MIPMLSCLQRRRRAMTRTSWARRGPRRWISSSVDRVRVRQVVGIAPSDPADDLADDRHADAGRTPELGDRHATQGPEALDAISQRLRNRDRPNQVCGCLAIRECPQQMEYGFAAGDAAIRVDDVVRQAQ